MVSDLEPICPIIKDMTNQDFNFLDRWLSGGSILPEDIGCHSELDLWENIGGRISENSYEAYQKALGSGLPPLPEEAKNFTNILFHQNQPEGILFPNSMTNFWGNLNGEWFGEIRLSLCGTDFCQGLSKMECQYLTLQNMGKDCSFEHMPRLAERGKIPMLNIFNCSNADKLSKTLADYLYETEVSEIQLSISNTIWHDFDPKIFDALFENDNFEHFEMTLRNSTLPGFLDSFPQVIDKVCKEEVDVVPPRGHNGLRQKLSKKLVAKRGGSIRGNFIINTDVVPFRRMDPFRQRDFSVLWDDKDLPNPQNSNKMLSW